MNEVLSQDEIDQLLTAISSGDTEADDFKPVNSARKIKIYDFKRPVTELRSLNSTFINSALLHLSAGKQHHGFASSKESYH